MFYRKSNEGGYKKSHARDQLMSESLPIFLILRVSPYLPWFPHQFYKIKKSKKSKIFWFCGNPNTNKDMLHVAYMHFHVGGGRFRKSQGVIEVDLSAWSDRAPQIHRGSDFCHSLRLIPTSVLRNLGPLDWYWKVQFFPLFSWMLSKLQIWNIL